MKTRRWAALATGASLAVVAGLVGGSGATSASGATTITPTPTPVSAGILTLSTSSSTTAATVGYYPDFPVQGPYSSPTDFVYRDQFATFGAPATTQSITTSGKCVLNPGNGALLGFTAASGSTKFAPSYLTQSIGVVSGNPNVASTACTQVNQSEGESLTLKLTNGSGSALSTAFGPALVKAAALDLNMSGNVVIQADLWKGGARVGGAVIESGFSAPIDLTSIYPAGDPNLNNQLFVCNYASNSGPQSGYNNNCWAQIYTLANSYTDSNNVFHNLGALPSTAIGAPDCSVVGNCDWDKITLTPLSYASKGAFSLQGGASYATAPSGVGGPTQFMLESVAQGQLDCNEATPAKSTDGNVTSIQVTRLDNGDSSTCTLIPYSLEASGGSGTFHKPLGNQGTAQFEVTFVRTLTPNTTTGVVSYPIPALKINWEDAAVNGGSNTVNTLTSCPAALFQNGFPNYQNLKNISPSVDMTTALNGLQYACQYGENQQENPDGSITVTDSVYLTGDAKFLT